MICCDVVNVCVDDSGDSNFVKIIKYCVDSIVFSAKNIFCSRLDVI